MMFPSVRGRFRLPRRPRFNDSGDTDPSSSEPAQDMMASDAFYPGLFDVFKVRHILSWKIISEGLPVEIVDMIMEAAEYWPSIEARMDTRTIIRQDHDRELLRTTPLCYDEETLQSATPVLPHRTIHPCRKIVFRILSHDQGWGGGPRGESPYDGSYTWFDAEIIHAIPQKGSNQTDSQASAEPTGQGASQETIDPQHSHFLPGPGKLQMNKTAVKQTQEYTITWHYLDNIQAESAEAEEIERSQGRGRATLDGNVVRTLGVGDSIAVWGRARFPGWSNHVEYISVRVFWAV